MLRPCTTLRQSPWSMDCYHHRPSSGGIETAPLRTNRSPRPWAARAEREVKAPRRTAPTHPRSPRSVKPQRANHHQHRENVGRRNRLRWPTFTRRPTLPHPISLRTHSTTSIATATPPSFHNVTLLCHSPKLLHHHLTLQHQHRRLLLLPDRASLPPSSPSLASASAALASR